MPAMQPCPGCCVGIYRKEEVERMAKEKDVKTIAERISALGIPVTITKSRLELLKALAPPANVPHPRTT